MAQIISLKDAQVFDFGAAIDEIELLVPKYLDILHDLEACEAFEDIPLVVKNVSYYWSRLHDLIDDVQSLERDSSLEEAIKNSLQTELGTLERKYMYINDRINLSKKHWTPAVWEAAEIVVQRMDEVLGALGFEYGADDRVFVREIQEKNMIKRYQ
jgi:hypothetical protein